MENKIVMPTGINYDRFRPRRVAEYGRVSSEHEAQLSALENQMQWYDAIAEKNKNWHIVNKYIDRGITGTQAKKRPAFLQMIEDAKHKKFDLIVTREVCRFARNTVDTLVVTRELKNLGVEVYFVEDNIWTMDGDGELRLTIMATLAQEESRKTSERVRAGQKISRDNGVLYGNGNILGYDRDKVTETYVINPEQAETVRMIYDMYQSGKGMVGIRDELIRRKRKDSSGLIRWDVTKISRILRNATYKGYQGYLKSQRNNFLDQKAIVNNNEDTYLYVKGKYEPIISEEQWDLCKSIRDKRRKECTYFTPDGEAHRNIGVHLSEDVWVKKLLCRCGYRFRRNKWRKNKNGDLIYGYKCYNQLNYGSKDVKIEAGIDVSDGCNLREICDWKFELMAKKIFTGLWGNRQDILDNISSLYKYDFQEEKNETESLKQELEKQIIKLDEKLNRLKEMRIENELSKEEYNEYKSKVENERALLCIKRSSLENGITDIYSVEDSNNKVKDFLLRKMDFGGHTVDKDIIKKFVHTIIPRTEEEFEWYLDFDLEDKPNEERQMLWEFTIGYDEAKKYRKETNGMLRPNQWRDLMVKVFI